MQVAKTCPVYSMVQPTLMLPSSCRRLVRVLTARSVPADGSFLGCHARAAVAAMAAADNRAVLEERYLSASI